MQASIVFPGTGAELSTEGDASTGGFYFYQLQKCKIGLISFSSVLKTVSVVKLNRDNA